MNQFKIIYHYENCHIKVNLHIITLMQISLAFYTLSCDLPLSKAKLFIKFFFFFFLIKCLIES